MGRDVGLGLWTIDVCNFYINLDVCGRGFVLNNNGEEIVWFYF